MRRRFFGAEAGNDGRMTAPDQDDAPEQTPDGTGETGALAAASTDSEVGGDPLGPLNRITEDGSSDQE